MTIDTLIGTEAVEPPTMFLGLLRLILVGLSVEDLLGLLVAAIGLFHVGHYLRPMSTVVRFYRNFSKYAPAFVRRFASS